MTTQNETDRRTRRREARAALARHLTQEADRAARNGTALALLHVEADGAADAESAHGPAAGRAVVSAIRSRLAKSLRSYDLVAHMGGATLAAVLSDVRGGPAVVSGLVERLAAAVSRPVRLQAGVVDPRTRVGVAIGRGRVAGPEMIRRAAVAVARADGTGAPAYHDPETDREMRLLRGFHDDLRQAIASGGIEVAFQPLFDPGADAPAGVEALARWSRDGRPVPPDVFVAHAEETGLIGALGEAVLRKACEAGAGWPDLSVAVNVSPIQLRDPGFPGMVESVLAETGFDPGRLEIELTEGVLASDPALVSDRLESLRSLGVRVALDDFGTGFSGLGYLRHFPFDRLKIDRSFVGDAGMASRAIIDAVLGMSRAMGFEVTAEGVETEAQKDYLVERGCDRLQGYLLGRPTSQEGITELLGQGRSPAP